MVSAAVAPSSSGTTFSAESYFETQPPPPTLDADTHKVAEFVQRQAHEGRRVVLVTVRGLLSTIIIVSSCSTFRRVVEQPFLSSKMCERQVCSNTMPAWGLHVPQRTVPRQL
jgi:hypothetical protein